MKGWSSLMTAAATSLALTFGGAAAHAQDKLTVWSHFADHEGVRAFFVEVQKTFVAENPGKTLDITFYEKQALFAAQTTALPAGQGPDIIYLEPDRMQFVTSNFVAPIDDLVDLNRLEQFAREAWTVKGKVYGVGMQAFTVELYYNTKLLAEVASAAGVTLGNDFQFTQEEFKKVVQAAAKKGITPIVQGIGDRPYPGSYLVHELLLRKLGRDDYAKLWAGKLSFKDKRVVDVFAYLEELVKLRAYPRTFTTLRLGESHLYFHTKPGGLMFPLGSWYSSRAFNAPDKGGQPEGFPLGIMQFPAMDGGACPKCKTIGVAGTYAVNAASKNKELAAKFLEIITRPAMGALWVQNTNVATGVKLGAGAKFTGKYASYFEELNARSADREFFLGTPIDFVQGACRDTYIQVLNAALPGGLLDAKSAAEQMDAACYKKS